MRVRVPPPAYGDLQVFLVFTHLAESVDLTPLPHSCRTTPQFPATAAGVQFRQILSTATPVPMFHFLDAVPVPMRHLFRQVGDSSSGTYVTLP